MEKLTSTDIEYIKSCFSKDSNGNIVSINMTPELAGILDGHCFIDIDMPDRLEAFEIKKSA